MFTILVLPPYHFCMVCPHEARLHATGEVAVDHETIKSVGIKLSQDNLLQSHKCFAPHNLPVESTLHVWGRRREILANGAGHGGIDQQEQPSLFVHGSGAHRAHGDPIDLWKKVWESFTRSLAYAAPHYMNAIFPRGKDSPRTVPIHLWHAESGGRLLTEYC